VADGFHLDMDHRQETHLHLLLMAPPIAQVVVQAALGGKRQQITLLQVLAEAMEPP
jgi:tRNA pseudouridine-54 N-methylase